MPYDEDMEQIEVLQKLNRAVRRRNKQLRTAMVHTRLYTDSVVADLFEAPSEATNALEKIRVFGGIDCSPDDYSKIVEVCIAALNQTPTSQ